jgi:hypothetical protein
MTSNKYTHLIFAISILICFAIVGMAIIMDRNSLQDRCAPCEAVKITGLCRCIGTDRPGVFDYTTIHQPVKVP